MVFRVYPVPVRSRYIGHTDRIIALRWYTVSAETDRYWIFRLIPGRSFRGRPV